jgi:hypothetical protein
MKKAFLYEESLVKPNGKTFAEIIENSSLNSARLVVGPTIQVKIKNILTRLKKLLACVMQSICKLTYSCNGTKLFIRYRPAFIGDSSFNEKQHNPTKFTDIENKCKGDEEGLDKGILMSCFNYKLQFTEFFRYFRFRTVERAISEGKQGFSGIW